MQQSFQTKKGEIMNSIIDKDYLLKMLFEG